MTCRYSRGESASAALNTIVNSSVIGSLWRISFLPRQFRFQGFRSARRILRRDSDSPSRNPRAQYPRRNARIMAHMSGRAFGLTPVVGSSRNRTPGVASSARAERLIEASGGEMSLSVSFMDDSRIVRNVSHRVPRRTLHQAHRRSYARRKISRSNATFFLNRVMDGVGF